MTRTHEVASLNQMPGCQLAEGTPDVRGWEVTSPTLVCLGVVKDLLVDLASSRVRYLDVLVDTESGARRVLLPIGKIWINDALDEIVVPVSTALDALPTYDPAQFDRVFEHKVLAAFGDRIEADFYSASAFGSAASRAGETAQMTCSRRDTDPEGAPCRTDDRAADGTEAANGVELRVVTEAAD